VIGDSGSAAEAREALRLAPGLRDAIATDPYLEGMRREASDPR